MRINELFESSKNLDFEDNEKIIEPELKFVTTPNRAYFSY